ncbi:MAG: hypothetical protein QOI86_5303 [Actinomycetota bacterium]|jgi:hypothetical protein|nr:hypothetical protein [Actinomycetota bacterium]
MESRGPTHTELVDGARRSTAVHARTVGGLRAIVRRARGWTCDVRGVALDDQSGKLHLPFLEKLDRRSPPVRVTAGELIVRRVEEFLVDGAARTRWFELDGFAYDEVTRRFSIASDGRSQFVLTVEELDITLRIRPQTRPHP